MQWTFNWIYFKKKKRSNLYKNLTKHTSSLSLQNSKVNYRYLVTYILLKRLWRLHKWIYPSINSSLFFLINTKIGILILNLLFNFPWDLTLHGKVFMLLSDSMWSLPKKYPTDIKVSVACLAWKLCTSNPSWGTWSHNEYAITKLAHPTRGVHGPVQAGLRHNLTLEKEACIQTKTRWTGPLINCAGFLAIVWINYH